MSVEITPRGVACNIKCVYCYQDPMRDAGNINRPLDTKAILRELDKHCGKHGFTVFGGEPLLTPMSELEVFFDYGLKKWSKNAIQTNGTLITPAHIELFKKYKVHVGFSVDGPDRLNEARCDRETTHRACANLNLCLDSGIGTSLITTLSTVNCGTWGKFNELFDWMRVLDHRGLASIRLHLLEVDNAKAASIRLDDKWAIEVLTAFWDREGLFRKARFDKFQEIERLLRGDHKDATCVWNGCDPLNTSAVVNIGPNGAVSNCGRTNKDGIIWLKTGRPSDTRTTILAHTTYVDGGCQDCRFFDACRGYCPGTAIDGDWRNRTAECAVLIGLFEHAERKLGLKVDLRYRQQLAPGDVDHGDAHGDKPHGDSHGDHTDVTGIHAN